MQSVSLLINELGSEILNIDCEENHYIFLFIANLYETTVQWLKRRTQIIVSSHIYFHKV